LQRISHKEFDWGAGEIIIICAEGERQCRRDEPAAWRRP